LKGRGAKGRTAVGGELDERLCSWQWRFGARALTGWNKMEF